MASAEAVADFFQLSAMNRPMPSSITAISMALIIDIRRFTMSLLRFLSIFISIHIHNNYYGKDSL